MMDSENEIWNRLQAYQRELAEVCDQISGEMNQKRIIREEWHKRTHSWKKTWMKKISSAGTNQIRTPSERGSTRRPHIL